VATSGSKREIEVDGRTLTVYDAGASDGPVILYHHGTPSTGAPLQTWLDDVQARGARLISYDRPGYGDSTPAPERNVAGAAADAAAIMDALGVERFVTWGVSGGGPHTLACAALLPDRVAAVASLGGVAPFDALGLNYLRGMGSDNIVEFGLAMAGRQYIAPYCESVAEHLRGATPAQVTEAIASLVSAPDLAALDGPIGEWWATSFPVAFAQSAAGWTDDDLAFVSPFGFEITQIAVPTLIVHGGQDRFVPVAHGQWLARAIAGAGSWISEDDGHLTLLVNRVPAVHEWLLRHL
jgi:pimeloyl-ACP methyl ester carboxylesterase